MKSPAQVKVGEPVNPTGKQGAATPQAAEQMKAQLQRLETIKQLTLHQSGPIVCVKYVHLTKVCARLDCAPNPMLTKGL